MAKKKKKGGNKGSVNLSPENYIKSRARALPIADCLITEAWQESGMANILVARKHVNGHRTVAIFLVDLKCLGIKDAGYLFNMEEYEFEDFVQKFTENDCVECAYNLVHNIIYGALEYAEDYGFSPYKNWEVAQYVLEEDDDRIPLIDIDFGGDDGNPMYISGPNEDAAKQDQILGILKRTVGEGNYHFMVTPNGMPEFEEDRDEDDEDEEVLFDKDYEEEDEETFAPGEIEEIMAGKKEPSLRQIVLLSAMLYSVTCPDDNFIDVAALNELVEIDFDVYPEIRSEDESEESEALVDVLVELMDQDDDDEEQLKKLNQFQRQYGDNPIILTMIFSMKLVLHRPFPEDIIRTMKEKFPDYLRFRFEYAIALVHLGRIEEAWTELGGELSLDEAFPERKHQFDIGEFSTFHVAVCAYFTAKGELGKAINYGGQATELNEEDPLVIEVVTHLQQAINDAVERVRAEKD